MSNIKDFIGDSSENGVIALEKLRNDAEYLNYSTFETYGTNVPRYQPLGIIRNPKKIPADCFGAIGKVNTIPTTTTTVGNIQINDKTIATFSFNKPGQIPAPGTPLYSLTPGEGIFSPLNNGAYPEDEVRRKYVVTALDSLGETTKSGAQYAVLNSGQTYGQVSGGNLGIGPAGQQAVSSEFLRYYSLGIIGTDGTETRPVKPTALTFSNKIKNPTHPGSANAVASGSSTLPAGTYESKISFLDWNGGETAASTQTTTTTIPSGNALNLRGASSSIGSFGINSIYQKCRAYFRKSGGSWRYVEFTSANQNALINNLTDGTAGSPPSSNTTDVSTSVYFTKEIIKYVFGLDGFSTLPGVRGFRLYKGASDDITTHKLYIDAPNGFTSSERVYASNGIAYWNGSNGLFYELYPSNNPTTTSPQTNDTTWDQRDRSVTISWGSVANADSYNIFFWNSDLSRYVKLNDAPISTTHFIDNGALDYSSIIEPPVDNTTDSYDASNDAVFSTLNNEEVILNVGDHLNILNLNYSSAPMEHGYSLSIPLTDI
jgi:hypothetical protein